MLFYEYCLICIDITITSTHENQLYINSISFINQTFDIVDINTT